MRHTTKILALSFIVVTACSTDKPTSDNIVESIVHPNTVTDFYHFKHLLPESKLAYDIEITDIKLYRYKDAFTTQKEQFSKPEKEDGRTLSVSFNITNPYPREMRIPFPDFFEITTKEFDDNNMYFYDKTHRHNVSSSTEIIDSNSKPLDKLGVWSDDAIGRVFQVDFTPNETKSFTINFKDPFHSTTKEIAFIGFNKYLKKEVADTYKLNEDELKKYLADKSTKYALLIDLMTLKVVDIVDY